VPRAQLSRVSSYDWLGSTALMPVGLILAAPAQAALGTGAVLLVSALAVVALSALAVAIPGIRRMPAPPVGPAAPRGERPHAREPTPI
jgi:hypothetical protein